MTTRSERLAALVFALVPAVPGLGFVVLAQGLPRGEDGPVMSGPEQAVWYAALTVLAVTLVVLVWISGAALVRRREPRGYAAGLLIAAASFAVALVAVSL